MKRDYLVKVFLLILTLGLSTSYAFGWDEVGHKISAYIAWEQMTPEVRDKVFKILLEAPEDSHLSVPYNFFNSRSEGTKRRELFMYAATWPDVIRDRKFEIRYTKYHHGNWHYADIFWKQEKGAAERLKNSKGAGGVAVSKLKELEKIMRNPPSPKASRAIALAWFLHIGGDIHNPLHNGSRVTDTEPKGDQGGNLVKLAPKIEGVFQLNLHSYWDGIIGRVKRRKNDLCDSRYLAPISRKIMKKFRYEKLQNRLKLNRYNEWNTEGFDLLNDVVYTTEIVRDQMPSKKYRKRAFKTAEEQIALAGYRLGQTLNQIFGAPKSGMENINRIDAPFQSKSGCKIIQRILYPVSKRRIPNQKLRIALLNICPPNRGMVARPTTSVKIGGEPVYYEFDVIRIFESKDEARRFAATNNIKDAKYK